MLYSLLAAVLILSFFMALVVPYLVIQAFLQGFNITARAEKREPVRKRKTKQDRQVDKKREELEKEIDNYHGMY